MKKVFCILGVILLLTGCNAQQTFETVADLHNMPAMAQDRKLELSLPEEAAVPSMESPDTGKMYLCDGYTLTVQTLESGDLNRSLRQLTGYEKSQLTLMKTKQDGVTRYASVWISAGEGDDQVNRLVLLDDGNRHYAVTVMAQASLAGSLTETWQTLLDSVKLVNTD